MIQPIRSVRRPTLALLIALSGGLLASCSDADVVHPDDHVVAIQVISRNPHPGVAGAWLPDSVRVRAVDAQGKGVHHVLVRFRNGSFSPESGITDADGYVRVAWRLSDAPTQTATVNFPGLDPVPVHARTVQLPATVGPVLGLLSEYLERALESNLVNLPRNQRYATFFEAKLAILRTPGLGGDIVDQHRYGQGSAASRSGAEVPITAVFPVEAMRGEAMDAVHLTEDALPVLEEFLDKAFPTPAVRIWYGFIVGASGGGGTMSIEDRTTYNARTQGAFMVYEPMVVHELSHTYMGHETLNQFLEVYGYNVARTGSKDIRDWDALRGWVPGRETNEGLHALLDIYQLVGPEVMADAYRAVLPLRPPFGEVLLAPVAEAFAAAVPASMRPQVAAKLAKVGY